MAASFFLFLLALFLALFAQLCFCSCSPAGRAWQMSQMRCLFGSCLEDRCMLRHIVQYTVPAFFAEPLPLRVRVRPLPAAAIPNQFAASPLPACGGGAPGGRPNFGGAVRLGSGLLPRLAVAEACLVGEPGGPARASPGEAATCSIGDGAADAAAEVSGSVLGVLRMSEFAVGFAVVTSEVEEFGADGGGGGAAAGDRESLGKSMPVRCHQMA